MSPRLIDRYLLAQTARRLLVALGVVLIALVLERLLRLFEYVADHGGAVIQVLQMAINLLPHYLGIALPAGFFISILLLMARLGDDNEIDVLLGSGLSIRRLARPLVLAGAVLAVFSILLFGYLQPYSRYAYRAIKHAATSAVWDGSVPEQTFLTPDEGLTLYADEADADGRILRGVFVHQVQEDGREVTSTARRGRLHADFDVGRAYLVLEDGVQVVTRPEQPPLTVHFESLTLSRDFPIKPPPYRARGGDARELTLLELLRGRMPEGAEAAGGDEVATGAAAAAAELAREELAREELAREELAPGEAAAREEDGEDEPEPITSAELVGEAHARLTRALSVVLMPLLAVPMGIAAKRRRRGRAVVVAAAILVLFHHILEFGEGMVELGTIGPALGLWLPFAVFALFCGILFRRADRQPGENPFEHVFERIDFALERLLGRLRRLVGKTS